ncbi:MAG: hypothetical protein ACI9UN_003866 [Granulosicoccus sp.]|jgi:hypothetical protein
MKSSFFTSDDNEWFQPTSHTRGPWDEHACHAGPPTALLARAAELLLPEQRLTRLSVNLLRPIPFQKLRIKATVQRLGRTVSTTEAFLIDEEGKCIVSAHGMHLTPTPHQNLTTQVQHIGDPETALPGVFPITQTLHGKPAFNGDGVSVRYPAGQDHLPGPTTAWLKTVPLLDYEPPSPFQKICPLADCGNAFGRNSEPSDVTFMNTDLTVVLHRDPDGDWLGSQSQGYWEPNGIGLADAMLFDKHGCVGRAMQTLVLRAR